MSLDDGLIAFWRARLDEDEATAKAATPGPWEVGWTVDGDGEHYGSRIAAMGTEKRMLLEMTTGYARSKHVRTAEHIARHDPARALRRIEGDRRLLAEVDKLAGDTGWDDAIMLAARCRVMEWSGHPEYRPEWKP